MDNNDYPTKIQGLRIASILIVEDDPAVRMLLRKQLQHFGVKVDAAADGAEAIRHVEQNRYCLILMDIQMPIMNGLEATAAIRDLERQKNYDAIPIIATTAGGASREKCLTAGMTDYLEKPIDMTKLESILLQWKCKETCRN